MLRIFVRRLAPLVLLAGGFASSGTPSLADTADLPVLRGIFSIHLNADKAVYTAGESIRLRLTVTNNASQTYSFVGEPPSALTDLNIVDANGKSLPQPQPVDKAAFMGGMWGYELTPGASVSPKYFARAQPPGTEWEDIAGWGYRLIEPGSYSIVAISRIQGYLILPGGTGTSSFLTDPSESNRIKITIKQ